MSSDGSSDISFDGPRPAELDFGGGAVTVRVQRVEADGTVSDCVESFDYSAVSIVFLRRRAGPSARIRVTAANESLRDAARRRPRAAATHRAVRRHPIRRLIDLRQRLPFVSGPYTGDLTSTLTTRPDPIQFSSSSSSSSSGSGPEPSPPTRRRAIRLRCHALPGDIRGRDVKPQLLRRLDWRLRALRQLRRHRRDEPLDPGGVVHVSCHRFARRAPPGEPRPSARRPRGRTTDVEEPLYTTHRLRGTITTQTTQNGSLDCETARRGIPLALGVDGMEGNPFGHVLDFCVDDASPTGVALRAYCAGPTTADVLGNRDANDLLTGSLRFKRPHSAAVSDGARSADPLSCDPLQRSLGRERDDHAAADRPADRDALGAGRLNIRLLTALVLGIVLASAASAAAQSTGAGNSQVVAISGGGHLVAQRNYDLTVSGDVRVVFRGDPGAGCAAHGVCEYSGTAVWKPGSSASATFLVIRSGSHAVLKRLHRLHGTHPGLRARSSTAPYPAAAAGECADASAPDDPLIDQRPWHVADACARRHGRREVRRATRRRSLARGAPRHPCGSHPHARRIRSTSRAPGTSPRTDSAAPSPPRSSSPGASSETTRKAASRPAHPSDPARVPIAHGRAWLRADDGRDRGRSGSACLLAARLLRSPQSNHLAVHSELHHWPNVGGRAGDAPAEGVPHCARDRAGTARPPHQRRRGRRLDDHERVHESITQAGAVCNDSVPVGGSSAFLAVARGALHVSYGTDTDGRTRCPGPESINPGRRPLRDDRAQADCTVSSRSTSPARQPHRRRLRAAPVGFAHADAAPRAPHTADRQLLIP